MVDHNHAVRCYEFLLANLTEDFLQIDRYDDVHWLKEDLLVVRVFSFDFREKSCLLLSVEHEPEGSVVAKTNHSFCVTSLEFNLCVPQNVIIWDTVLKLLPEVKNSRVDQVLLSLEAHLSTVIFLPFYPFSGLDQPAHYPGVGGVGGQQWGQRRSQSISGALSAGDRQQKERIDDR